MSPGQSLLKECFINKHAISENIGQQSPMPIIAGSGIEFQAKRFTFDPFPIPARGFRRSRLGVVDPPSVYFFAHFRTIHAEVSDHLPVGETDRVTINDLTGPILQNQKGTTERIANQKEIEKKNEQEASQGRTDDQSHQTQIRLIRLRLRRRHRKRRIAEPMHTPLEMLDTLLLPFARKSQKSDTARAFDGRSQQALMSGAIARNAPRDDLTPIGQKSLQSLKLFIVNVHLTRMTKPTGAPFLNRFSFHIFIPTL